MNFGMTEPTITYRDEGQNIVAKISQDINPVLEEVKRNKEIKQDGDMRLAAQIPVALLSHWCKQDGVDYFRNYHDFDVQLKLMKRLNSPEFKNLRVWEGRLGREDIKV